MATSTTAPEPSVVPTVTPPALAEADRQTVGEYFSFIPVPGYAAELEDTIAYLQNETGDVSISLALIGVGEDERLVEDVLTGVFEKFSGLDRGDPVATMLDGLAANQMDFNGVLGQSVLSGSYVVVDLGDEASFLAFAFANVTADQDDWLHHGNVEFAQLLNSIQLAPLEE